MGCVTSKHLKKQAITDGWAPRPNTTMPQPKKLTSRYSVHCHHRHFVSLTSTAYGSLKMEPLTNPERPTVASFTDMYGMLSSFDKGNLTSLQSNISKSLDEADRAKNLGSNAVVVAATAHAMPFCHINSSKYNISQMMEPLHNSPLNGIDTMCNTISPSPQPRSLLMGLESSPQWSISPAKLGLPETINVKEMMMGLEEAAPFSKDLSPIKSPNSNISTPTAKALRQHNQELKRKAGKKEGNGVGKENTSPPHNQHVRYLPLSQTWNASYKSSAPTQDTSSLPQLSQQAAVQKVREVCPFRHKNEVAFKRGSSIARSHIDKSSPGLSSASATSPHSVNYAPSDGKVWLSLHTHQNNGASIDDRTPTPLPGRTMSRRSACGGGLIPSSPTFDPELVATYEKALSNVSQFEWNATHVDSQNGRHFASTETGTTKGIRPWLWSSMSLPIAELDKQLYNPLDRFEEKCPPGGACAVVLYTTTLRGIRKTFEDCNAAREILQSFGVSIDERDVSMHLEFLNELKELMGRVVSVPRIFIKGRYIGGIEEALKLHEDKSLSELVEGLPKERNSGSCDGCGGIRFVPCLECSGSCKLRREEDNRVIRCPDCNENGLIQCPICT